MLILEIVGGIRRHFHARAGEWALATILFNWGWILLLPEETLSSPGMQFLLNIAPEGIWGMACISVGAARLVALFINGTFADTAYSRFSPHVRTTLALLSCFFWLQITLAVTIGRPLGTGAATYPVILVLEIWNIFRASCDARESDMAARSAA